jgi:hypothetical protein
MCNGLALRAQGAKRRRRRGPSVTRRNAAVAAQARCLQRIPFAARASEGSALLDDVHRHRLRRATRHQPLRRLERNPSQFSDRLPGGKRMRRRVPDPS